MFCRGFQQPSGIPHRHVATLLRTGLVMWPWLHVTDLQHQSPSDQPESVTTVHLSSQSPLTLGHFRYFHLLAFINDVRKNTFVYRYHHLHEALFPLERVQEIKLWIKQYAHFYHVLKAEPTHRALGLEEILQVLGS
jgi:hypothetical protein